MNVNKKNAENISMKKIVFIIMMIFTCKLFALDKTFPEKPVALKEFPTELYGIWEGDDRFVFIEDNKTTGKVEIVIILKEFYGWYFDRALEAEDYSNVEKRVRNAATPKKAETVSLNIQDISRSQEEDFAWELILAYTKSDVAYVPICLLDDKIYLNFYLKNLEYDENNNPIITEQGIWRGNVFSEGIKVCNQSVKENIGALIVDGEDVFDIRYWKTKMDFTNIEAYVNYKDKEYKVFKHLISAGNTYACTTGRSINVRNVVPPQKFIKEDYIFNANKTVMIKDKKPYLTKIIDKSTYEQLMQIVKIKNAKRKPPRKPLFDDVELDFHWDLIIECEKYNEQVQELRKHQKEFVEYLQSQTELIEYLEDKKQLY